MKKMRGFIDPFTLGILLATSIGVLGVNAASNMTNKQQEQQVNVQEKQNPAEHNKEGNAMQYANHVQH